MILSLLLSQALALPPDGMAALLPIGSGRLESMSVSWDGDVVVGVDAGDKAAFLLHVEDWSTHAVAPCTVRSAAYIGYDDHFGEVWVGCGDGTVRGVAWDPIAGTLSDIVDEDGAAFVLDFGAPADGLWFSAFNGLLYGLNDDANGVPVLHNGDPFTGDVDLYGYPLTMPSHTGFNEGVLLDDENTLVVHHSGQNLSNVSLSSGVVVPSVIGGAAMTPVDLFPSWFGGVYGVSTSGTLGEYIQPQWSFHLQGLNEPNAVIANLDPDDPWLAVTGGDVRVWELDPDTGAIMGTADTPYFLSVPDTNQNWIQDGVTSEGYLWGGGTAGFLHIATARPWVDPAGLSVTPTAGTAGDLVTVAFSLGEAGDWELRRGGDRTGGGVLLDSGTAAGPTSLESVVEITQQWDEGTNFLYVILEDGVGQTGHARGEILIDNPPNPPTLTPPDLDFGDRSLVLSFDGIEDADLLEYQVYVSTAKFDPDSYATGGPEYSGTKLTTPIVVGGTPGARVSVDIQPLKNDVKHYVAVRAVDQGGLVGPMSNVISETPRPAYSAAQLAGEEGGPRCATTPGAAGWLAVGLAAIAGLRRRRAPAGLALAALMLAPAAMAQSGEKKGLEKDLTKQTGDFELRYGGIVLQDDTINDVYRDGQNNILQIEFGPQFGRIIEFDVGVGFFQELAYKIDDGGRQSGDRTMLTWWPALALDATARLHVIDEQIIVPYVRAGFDWVVWSEKWDAGSGKDVIRGDKFGNHFGLGGSLLLDPFDKKRASLLEAQTGINDTYLTFEWRRQRVDDRRAPWAPAPNRARGLDFSATMFTVGLKLDY